VALDPTRLVKGLRDIFHSHPSSPGEAAQRWAAMYAGYALQANTVVGGVVVSVAANQQALAESLALTFATSRLAPTTAAQMASALSSFWLAPPVSFAGTFPGVVTLTPGTPALQAQLVSTWAQNLADRAPADLAASRVASVVDAFTRTVIALSATTPTPTAAPII
jgi:hypothetical protein